MGYERKLYVVSEWDTSGYADIIATIKLGKIDCYAFDDLFTNDAKYPIYLLEYNGDYSVSEDKYGDTIKSEYPGEVLKALSEDYKVSHYERDKIAIDLIRSIMENHHEEFIDERLMIYSYGY